MIDQDSTSSPTKLKAIGLQPWIGQHLFNTIALRLVMLHHLANKVLAAGRYVPPVVCLHGIIACAGGLVGAEWWVFDHCREKDNSKREHIHLVWLVAVVDPAPYALGRIEDLWSSVAWGASSECSILETVFALDTHASHAKVSHKQIGNSLWTNENVLRLQITVHGLQVVVEVLDGRRGVVHDGGSIRL